MSKTIMITGISGFFGSHFLEHIMKNTDWLVIGTHRGSQAGSLYRVEDVLEGHDDWRERIIVIRHDFNDAVPEHVAKKIPELDYIIHVAANSHVDRSIDEPMRFLRDNVESTLNLFEWVRSLPKEEQPEKILYFGTDEVYGNALDGVDHDEESPHRPRNPYAASKAAAEDFCNAYRVTYGLPILITNTMNLFGERQDSEKYIPLVMKKILNNEELFIHGYPDGKRAGSRKYLHCRNACAATLFALEKGVVGGRYNVVGEKEIDNLELALLIESLVREWYVDVAKIDPPQALKWKIVDFHSARPGHDLRYSLDGTKLKELGYEHNVEFEKSLRKTVYWMLENAGEWLL